MTKPSKPTVHINSGSHRLLSPLILPAGKIPMPADENLGPGGYGIGVRTVEGGLKFRVNPWSTMNSQDYLRVFWDMEPPGDPLWDKLIEEDEENQAIEGTLDPSKIQPGKVSSVLYDVRRAGSSSSEPSVQNKVLVKLNRPGGLHNDSTGPGHSELHFDLPPGAIGLPEAQNGVPIKVSYPNIRKNDTVVIGWGNQRRYFIVSQEQALNGSLEVIIDKETIEAAGDGEIGVVYQVVDVVGNYPDPRAHWSKVKYAEVDLAGNKLPIPVVINPDPNATDHHVIDLNKLLENNLEVLVNTFGGQFQTNDTIILTWHGTPAQGSPIIYISEPIPVRQIGVPVMFEVSNSKVTAIAQGFASVSYTLKREGANERPSKAANVSVIGQLKNLKAPKIEQVCDGVLDPNERWATVTIPYYEGRDPSDVVTLIWEAYRGDGSLVTYEDARPVGEAPQDQAILRDVTREDFIRFNGLNVDVYYQVDDGKSSLLLVRDSLVFKMRVGEVQPTLPLPEVINDHGWINPDKIPPSGIRVIMPYVHTWVGDRVTLRWHGSKVNAPDTVITLSTANAGSPVTFTVLKEYIVSNFHGQITVDYSIVRKGELLGNSFKLDLRVGAAPGFIVGSRSQSSPYYYSTPSRLVAVVEDSETVRWTYEGDLEGSSSRSFLDTEPERALKVTISNAQLTTETTLRANNITGTYYSPTHHSGCIVKDDGTLFGWSSIAHMRPPPDLKDVLFVAGGGRAYATIQTDKRVRSWGEPEYGGSIPPQLIQELQNIRKLAANGGAFVALRLDGAVIAWGHGDYGGVIPAAISSQLRNVKQVVGSTSSFTAILNNGKVLSWGAEWPEGQLIEPAEGALSIVANNRAFAAITADNRVVAWGSAEHGGNIPSQIEVQLRNITLLSSTSAAFAALKEDGTVVAWGHPRFGGLPEINLSNIQHIQGSTTAFCALTKNGQLVAWGEKNEGADLPITLFPSLALSSAYGTFASILEDRSSVSWGKINDLYAASAVNAIYAAGANVVALTAQGTLHPSGANSPDLDFLAGKISYTKPSYERLPANTDHPREKIFNSVTAIPTVRQVEILGEANVGGTLRGSYIYENVDQNPEGVSIYRWYINNVVSDQLDLKIVEAYAGKLVTFSVTPVSLSNEVGVETFSQPKLVMANGYQNISDSENENSFMKQHGNFSFYTPEPPDRIFVSTGGAFSLLDGKTQDVHVRGQNEYGAVVPPAIVQLLKNNPAAVLFSTERDFAALVNVLDSNRLLLWGQNIPANTSGIKLNGIKSVYSNRDAFAFIYNNPAPGDYAIGAIGNTASGGTVPEKIQMKLFFDPPKAIYATENAFAVLTNAGKVYAWGNTTNGGVIGAQSQALLDSIVVTNIVSTATSFCAIDEYGEVVTWGLAANGGVIPAKTLESILDDGGVLSVIASRAAFCAITRGRKKAYSWGLNGQGGDMSVAAKGLAVRGNIVICKAATWAFCIISTSGQAEAWGAAGHGGVLPETKTEPASIGELLGASQKKQIEELFASMPPQTALLERVTSRVITVGGIISLYANDASFFLLSRNENGTTHTIITWGQANAGGVIPGPIKQVMEASLITGVYCTNGAYGVVMKQGAVEGAVQVWGTSLAMLDAGEIPKELEQHLKDGVVELYSIKRMPPVSPTPSRPDPSFGARKTDGSYVLWGGNVVNQHFIPS